MASDADMRSVETARIPRLGLRARMRAVREARMISERIAAQPGDLRAAAMRTLRAMDGDGSGR